MSATSPILFAPVVDLRRIPDFERDVIRRFWTEYMRGLGPENDKEWRRLGRDLFRAAPGEGFQVYRAESRDTPFHKRHRAILGQLLEHQEVYDNVDVLHDWLKLKCWHVDWEGGKPVPATTSFDGCSEARMRLFNRRLMDLLHKPWVQRHFWPHLPPALRHEMVEIVLGDQKSDQPAA